MTDSIEIVISGSETASYVMGTIVWSGNQSVPEDIIKARKRKQKAIDRIAWEAERQQRYQKGGH